MSIFVYLLDINDVVMPNQLELIVSFIFHWLRLIVN